MSVFYTDHQYEVLLDMLLSIINILQLINNFNFKAYATAVGP